MNAIHKPCIIMATTCAMGCVAALMFFGISLGMPNPGGIWAAKLGGALFVSMCVLTLLAHVPNRVLCRMLFIPLPPGLDDEAQAAEVSSWTNDELQQLAAEHGSPSMPYTLQNGPSPSEECNEAMLSLKNTLENWNNTSSGFDLHDPAELRAITVEWSDEELERAGLVRFAEIEGIANSVMAEEHDV